MQIDITFSGKNPKLRSKTWGTDEVVHPSRKFGKGYLQGRLRLLRLVVLHPGGAQNHHRIVASTDTLQKNTSTKNLQGISRSLLSACFMSVQNCSKSFLVKVMSHSC